MKIYDIIAEQQQVDEILGVIPGVTRAADAAKKAYQGYQRGKDLKTANAIRKARSAKNIFGQYKYSLNGLKGQARIDMIAKRAIASSQAAAKAKAGISAMPGAGTIIQTLGLGVIVYNYLTQIWSVENDFEEFKAAKQQGKEVSNADNMFGGMATVEEARELALETREELLGYATAQIIAVAGLAGKFVSVIASALKLIPGIGPVIGYPMQGFGWLLGKLSGGNTALAASTRLALVAWVSSPQGIEFLRKWSNGWLIALGGLVTDWLGEGAAIAIDTMVELGDQAAKWVSEKTGIAVSVPDAARSKLQPTQAEKDAAASADSIPASNAPTINGIRITDKDGYLRSDPDFYNNLKIKNAVGRAVNAGQPSPLDQAKRKPGVTYPEFIPSSGRFS